MNTFIMSTEDFMELEHSVEPKLAPDGKYLVTIEDYKTDNGMIIRQAKPNDEGKTGGQYVMPVLKIIEHPQADLFPPIVAFLGLPDANWKAAKSRYDYNTMVAVYKSFMKCFGVYSNSLDFPAIIGKTGNVIVASKVSQYGLNGRANIVSQWVI